MNKLKDKLILKTFNKVHIAAIIVPFVVYGFITYFVGKWSLESKELFMELISLGSIVYFFSYKINLSKDEEYGKILEKKGFERFNWWAELPLHMCNVNTILIGPAVLLHCRPILICCFFSGTLGALLAIVMPCLGMSDGYFFKRRIFDYFFTHYLIIANSLNIVFLSIALPQFSDILSSILILIGETFVTFIICTILRKSKLAPNANYFYNYDPEGNPVLMLFKKLVPLPFVYLLLAVPVALAYMWLVCYLITLFI